jgi:hypothetical protein
MIKTCPVCNEVLPPVPRDGPGDVISCPQCGEWVRLETTPDTRPKKNQTPVRREEKPVHQPKSAKVVLKIGVPVGAAVLLVFLCVWFWKTKEPEIAALRKGLDSWVFGENILDGSDVCVCDANQLLFSAKLINYQIGVTRRGSDGRSDIAVILVFESKARTELKEGRQYSCFNQGGKWYFIQSDDSGKALSEWLERATDESKKMPGVEKAAREVRDRERELARCIARQMEPELIDHLRFMLRMANIEVHEAELVAYRELSQKKAGELRAVEKRIDNEEVKKFIGQMAGGLERIARAGG